MTFLINAAVEVLFTDLNKLAVRLWIELSLSWPRDFQGRGSLIKIETNKKVVTALIRVTFFVHRDNKEIKDLTSYNATPEYI